jgi:hypothetical protein
MSKKRKAQQGIVPQPVVSSELALKVFACLESLAAKDTYETEYDGQMMVMCHDCGWLERGPHEKGCVFLEAQELIKCAYGSQQ